MTHQTTSLRIVSLLPSATEIVCGLGLQRNLVGISHECNWPPEVVDRPRVTRSNVDSSASSAEIDQQVKSLMASGRDLYEVDEELLVSLQPDLIVTQSQCDVCAISYSSVKSVVVKNEALRRTRLVSLNPMSLSAVLEDIERIGRVVRRSSSGKAYRHCLQQRIDVVVAKTNESEVRPRVLVIEWTDPLMISGNWTPELIELAGGICGLATPGEHSKYVTWNEIVDFSPELLIVAPCGFDLARSKAELQRLAENSEWHQLPAVKSGAVHAVDGDALFNRPGPRLVESLELLAGMVLQTQTIAK